MPVHFQLPPPVPPYVTPAPVFTAKPQGYYMSAMTVGVTEPLSQEYLDALAEKGHAYRSPGEELRDVLPELFEPKWLCPIEDCREGRCKEWRLYDQIQHLNDEHRWTREHIADWLDSLDVDLTFKPAQRGD